MIPQKVIATVALSTTALAFVAPARRGRLQTCLATMGSIPNLLELPVSVKLSSDETAEGTVSLALSELRRRTSSACASANNVLPFASDDAAGAEVWLLRFLATGLEPGSTIDVASAEEAVRDSLAWRLGEGRAIVEAACTSYAKATEAGAWNNEPVLAAAPFSSKISPHIGPAKLLTLRNARGDGLIYAIRAGQIDDKALMASVTAEELADFFLYAKAVNERVCASLAAQTNRLSDVVTVNDLSSVDLFGDATFRDALSAASKVGDKIFPGLAGPTLLLNLPALLQALVKIFTPLFPASVQKRLKFAKYPLASPETFLDRASPERADFLNKVDAILAA